MSGHLRCSTIGLLQVRVFVEKLVITEWVSVTQDVDSHLARWIRVAVFGSQHYKLLLHTRPEVSVIARSDFLTHADLSAMKAVWKSLLRSSVSIGSTVFSGNTSSTTHQVLRSSTRDVDSSGWIALVPPIAMPLCISDRRPSSNQSAYPMRQVDQLTRRTPSQSI